MIDNIHWLGHDSFRIDGDVTLVGAQADALRFQQLSPAPVRILARE